MVEKVDIRPTALSMMLRNWWQWVLLSVGITAVLIGVVYVATRLIIKLRRHFNLKRQERVLKRLIEKTRAHLSASATIASTPRISERSKANKPTSFRIYLGAFDAVITDDQLRILCDWDLVILDPLQAGVKHAVTSNPRSAQIARFVLGRLNLETLLSLEQHDSDLTTFTTGAFDQIFDVVSSYFPSPSASYHGYTGVLLAGWEVFFSVPVLNELSKELAKRGLEVYLETRPANFLGDVDAIAAESISGLVIRNGLLWPNGERRDCFDLETLRPTIKAFMSQECLRPFLTMMWEDLDNDSVVSSAVMRRTFSWYRFHDTLSWIAPNDASVDAKLPPLLLEPLSAFEWLKETNVIQLQNLWRNNQPISGVSLSRLAFQPVGELFPALSVIWQDHPCDSCGSTKLAPEEFSSSPEWIGLHPPKVDTFSISEAGFNYDSKGCFPIGVDITEEDFAQVVQSQRRLRKLDLLNELSNTVLQEFGTILRDFARSDLSEKCGITFSVQEIIAKLSRSLGYILDDGAGNVRIYQGLDTGFHSTAGKRFWGVYSIHASDETIIYVSSKVEDMISTVLHIFLSSQGCPRRQCFEAELAFAEWSGSLPQNWQITKQVLRDIESLTPTESLLLLQRLNFDEHAVDTLLLKGICRSLKDRLLKQPSAVQLRRLNAFDYLQDSIDAHALIASRINNYCEYNLRHPSHSVSLQLFLEVEEVIQKIVKERRISDLEAITEALRRTLKSSCTDTVADIFALAIFCAMRKLAFEEVYIEVTDRNPLFNDQADQAAAFAELFGLGSRCEAYFDMSPSDFGKLMLRRYREQYSNPLRQPPLYEERSVALQTAYSGPQMDVESNSISLKMSPYQHFTFISIFAVPALIDVFLLTTTKHGLYLSGRMSDEEQKVATIAFMLSLPISGAIGTWIASGGTYYLTSMAFSAMNYFVITRLLGGLVFLVSIASIGFIAISCVTGIQPALIFFLYQIALTTYLSLLAALANYNLRDSAFQSGRKIIILCIPILFISPILTIMFPGYDSQIYLTVLYVFITLLFLGTRHIGSLWTTWLQKIEIIDDKTLRGWYIDRGIVKDDQKTTEPALLKQARQEMLCEVLQARPKLFNFKTTKDPLVLKLANCFEATSVMMDWYSLSSGQPKSTPFSSTWNIQSKVALQQLKDSQRGIRFHNGFLHWRQAGDEIGCTILYFIIALLDKWIALLGGGQSIDGQMGGSQLLGLTSTNPEFRFSIGFSLAYYLLGAVLLDYNADYLHKLAAECKQDIIQTDDGIQHAIKIMSQRRSALYWMTLLRYLFLHIWSLAIMSALMLVLSSTREAVILFLCYVLAYTGLLWYQYTKTFSGPHALKPLLIGVCFGVLIGFTLRYQFPNFMYSDVIALGTGTWCAAILSLWAVKIITKTGDAPVPSSNDSYHAFYSPGPDAAWSQTELQSHYDFLRSQPADQHFRLDPESYHGQQIQLILLSSSGKLSNLARDAFPSTETLFDGTVKAFHSGTVVVEFVSVKHFEAEIQRTRAISYAKDGFVWVLVTCDAAAISSQNQISQHCLYNIAEILLHTVAESFFGYSHHDASLAESLVKNDIDSETPPPHSINCQTHAGLGNAFISILGDHFKQELLRNLCLGFNPDIQWDILPENIRSHLLQRCLGRPSSLNESQKRYVRSALNGGLDFDVYLARCDYGAYISSLYHHNSTMSPTRNSVMKLPFSSFAEKDNFSGTVLFQQTKLSKRSIPRQVIGYIWHKIGTVAKFYAVAFIADAEYQRELNCSLSGTPKIVGEVVKFFLDSIWVVSKTVQSLFLPYFLFHNRKNISTLWKSIQGREVVFKQRHIDIQTLESRYTAFVHHHDDGTFGLYQYQGEHGSEPENRDKLCYINNYSANMSLLRREEFQGGESVNVSEYDYLNPDEADTNRLSKSRKAVTPITRRIVTGRDQFQIVQYNRKGLIESGSYMKDDNLIRFHYHYRKVAKLDGDLLRAEFVLPHMSCTVSWCAPPPRHSDQLEKWISYGEVTEATFVLGTDVWESKYTYDHKCHPIISTTLNGQQVETPPIIRCDHLNVLKKPKNFSFLDDNPLWSFASINPNPISRWLGIYKRSYPFSTSQSRSWLWKAWKNNHEYDGVVVRWMDERLLRRDDILKPYWRRRDWGHLSSAEAYLERNCDAIMARVDLDNSVSSWTPLSITMNDLATFGPGGDACARTRSNLTSQEQEDGLLHVIAADTGTWPNEGGGVSACRRDMINNLKSVKWHMVVESANDFGIPKHQIERNVHSLKVIPLWGLDLMTPTHGLFQNRLDSEIKYIPRHADVEDIAVNFIPILETMVSGARSLEFQISDIKQMTRALVSLNAYFGEGNHHWSVVWKCKVVKNAWRRLWLSKLSNNVQPCSLWLRSELPTLGQLDQGLELWSRYLFIFSIQVPEKMPDVFQASHHSVSASFGIVCKIKRQCTLQIWDHAISWRETNLYLSSALCPLAPFVRNSLLGLMRMTSVLVLHHADTILPCADFFNPGWEVEIGTCQGSIENRNSFMRKIDPVVNGIINMQRFAPVKEIKTKAPTVTMLSHVWYAKDIKTAILAADIIVNEWGFKDYQLDIYGAVDKAPAYSTNCQEIISTKSLSQNVSLCGEADPITVLEKTWVFLNSSISEGLPLALGEAALTGAPVVCTDVGASLRVLTDPETNERYSAIVAPNDARAMAKAQIHLLAMMGEWYPYAESPEQHNVPITNPSSSSLSGDSSSDRSISETASMSRIEDSSNTLVERALTSVPDDPTAEEVKIITKRMYDQSPARRRLGMRSRAIVQKSFSGERYLREHEQMLWIGKAMKDMRRVAAGEKRLTDHFVLESAETSLPIRNCDVLGCSRESFATSKRDTRESGFSQAQTLCPPSSDMTSVLTDSIISIVEKAPVELPLK